jgi:hypothetical protein
MQDLLAKINGSKLMMGIAMLLLNVGSKYIEIGFSQTQAQALRVHCDSRHRDVYLAHSGIRDSILLLTQ